MATSSGNTVYHVTPNERESGWKVKEELSESASSTHDSKSEAQEEAHKLAERNRPSICITHREDGTIETQNTYT